MASTRSSNTVNGAMNDLTEDKTASAVTTPSNPPPASLSLKAKQLREWNPPLPEAPMAEMASSTIWSNPVYRNQRQLNAIPKWLEDVDISNPDSPYHCYYVKPTPAELREAREAESAAKGEHKPWYADCYTPKPKEPEEHVPCSFIGHLAVPAKGGAGVPADGINVKSEAQKKLEKQLAEKQARRDSALAMGRSTKAGIVKESENVPTLQATNASAVNDFEAMLPPPKSAPVLRAEDEDPTAKYVNDIASALNPANIQIGKKAAVVNIPAKKAANTKPKKLARDSDSGYMMTAIDESWAAKSGAIRTVHYGVEPVMGAISKVDKQKIRLVHATHADGKLEGFLVGIDTNQQGYDSVSSLSAAMDCKEWFTKCKLVWKECLGLEEVNEMLHKYEPQKMVSSHFPMSNGRYDVFIYGQSKTGVGATVAGAKEEAITSVSAPKKKTAAGPLTPADSISSEEDNSSDSETEVSPKASISLKRKLAQKAIEQAGSAKRKKTAHEYDFKGHDDHGDDHTLLAQHVPPTPPPSKANSPEPVKQNILRGKADVPSKKSNGSKNDRSQDSKQQNVAPLSQASNSRKKRKVVADEGDDEQEPVKRPAKKSKPTKTDDQTQPKGTPVSQQAKSSKRRKLAGDENDNDQKPAKHPAKSKLSNVEEQTQSKRTTLKTKAKGRGKTESAGVKPELLALNQQMAPDSYAKSTSTGDDHTGSLAMEAQMVGGGEKSLLTDDKDPLLALQEQMFKEAREKLASEKAPVTVNASSTPANKGEEGHVTNATATSTDTRPKNAKKRSRVEDDTHHEDDAALAQGQRKKRPKQA